MSRVLVEVQDGLPLRRRLRRGLYKGSRRGYSFGPSATLSGTNARIDCLTPRTRKEQLLTAVGCRMGQ
jgi:hypothetical protein